MTTVEGTDGGLGDVTVPAGGHGSRGLGRHPLAVNSAVLSYLRRLCAVCTLTVRLCRNQNTGQLDVTLSKQCLHCTKWFCHNCRDVSCKATHRQIRSELSAFYWENLRDFSPPPPEETARGRDGDTPGDTDPDDVDFWSARSVQPHLVSMTRRLENTHNVNVLVQSKNTDSSIKMYEGLGLGDLVEKMELPRSTSSSDLDICCLQEDSYMVVNGHSGKVSRYTGCSVDWQFSDPALGAPCRAVSVSGRLLLRWTRAGAHTLHWLDADGACAVPFAEHLQRPCGLGVSRRGHVVVTDALDGTARLLGSGGEVIHQFHTGLEDPLYVHCTARGAIVVSDPYAHRVRLYDAMGAPVWDYGSRGRGMTSLMEPCGLTSDEQGNIFICDKRNNRVVMLTEDGVFVQMIVSDIQPEEERVMAPAGIDINSDGQLVLLDNTNISTYRYR